MNIYFLAHRLQKQQQRGSSILQAGFTLIELLVVCAIIVIVTAIVLVDQNKFGGQVLLQNFAYDVALSIRQAQVYGISVQGFSSGSSTSFNSGYGVDFNMSTPTSYQLFADTNGNGLYDGAAEQVPPTLNITRGYKIAQLCAPAGSDIACTGGAVVSKLDIAFVRPEPDAYIAANSSQCFNTQVPCLMSARIVLVSPRGDEMSVVVSDNGQISVDQKTVIQP